VKLSDLSDQQWYSRLNARRCTQADDAKAWWDYVDLEQPLHYVARILLEQKDRFPPLLIAWAELVLDSLEERLDLEGFRLAGQDSANTELSKAWQANDLDEGSGEAHYAALATGHAYLMVGPGEGNYPLITVEYPDQVAVEIDPRTRRPMAALKTWREELADITTVDRAVLYLPGRTIEFESGQPVSGGAQPLGDWARTIQGQQAMPLVPVVPMLNRPRRGVGRSELIALKPIVDAANQTATNMMAAIEHHALPRKWAVGVSEGQFEDENGNKIPAWKAAMGDVWAVPHSEQQNRSGVQAPEVKLGQFSASDLRNFHESIKQLATLAASMYGLPPNYMGYTSDNPVSAEAIRYSLDRLVKRAERRQRTFGGAWERAMRIAWTIMGNDPAEAIGLESKWRDPSTPTRASMADAAQKLAGGTPIIDREQAWEDLQYSEGQKDGMRRRFGSTGGFAQTVVSGLKSLNVGSGEGVQPGVTDVPAPAGG
jgi:hypothetical protein